MSSARPIRNDAALVERTPSDDESPQEVPLDGLTVLQALCRGPDGAKVLEELRALATRVNRAERHRRALFARLQTQRGEPLEVAVVCDLSDSGVRLQLSTTAHLDVMHSQQVSIEMRLPGMLFVRCEATFVRVATRTKDGVTLAFAFSAATRRDPALLELVTLVAGGFQCRDR